MDALGLYFDEVKYVWDFTRTVWYTFLFGY